MTKSEWRVIKQAREIMEKLTETDGKNEQLDEFYRKSLIETEDHMGMFAYSVEKAEDKIFSHPFWNDELAEHVQKTVLSKDVVYRAHVGQEPHLEYTLTLDADTPVDDWEYENYLDEAEAWADVKELMNMGFKIEVPEGTPLNL